MGALPPNSFQEVPFISTYLLTSEYRITVQAKADIDLKSQHS
jgi:hypothetical protein